MKSDNQRGKEKDLLTLVPSQISPNPQRRRGGGGGDGTGPLNSPIYESSNQASSFSTSSSATSGLLCDEPVLNFENLLQKRQGSVLGQDVILKSEHFFQGTSCNMKSLSLIK